MNRIVVGPEGSFLRATTLWSICRRKSGAHRDAKAFTILKNEPFVQSYELLASSFSPRSILELGIFQGGSFVFLDKIFKPRRCPP